MIDLARLRRLCEAALPGPWRWTDFHHLDRRDNPNGITIGGISESDRAYLEAFDPSTVLALLDRIEGAERIIEIAKEFRDKGTKLTSCDRGPCQQVVECDDRSDPQARLYDALAAMEKRGGAAEKMGTKE